MDSLIQVVLPVFLVIGFGYAAVRFGLFEDTFVDGLMKFTQNFAIPCLLFTAVSELDLRQSFDWRLLISYYAGSATVYLLGIFGARYIFDRSWEASVAIGFCALYANSVLVGLPITERAFGPESLDPNYAIVAIHAPFCFTLGMTAMAMAQSRGRSGLALTSAVLKAIFKNALMIGLLLGFAVNLGNITLPQPVLDAVGFMERAAIPAALFALGGVLVRYRIDADLKEVAFICVLSLLVHPAIVYGLGTEVTGITDAQLRSAIVTASMAPGVNTYIFANMYGVALRVSASSVLIGTAASILTTSAWLLLI
ncbi:MAG: AEC family transporter [Pseudomonadota bacterium]